MKIAGIVLLSVLLVLSGAWWIHENRMSLRFASDTLEVVDLRKRETEYLREPHRYELAIDEVDWEKFDATSLFVFNPVTSQIFYKRNESEKRPIASITKLMTALVSLDVYQLDQEISVTKDIEINDRRTGIRVGDTVMVRELLEAMLIESKNDAAHILANEYGDGYDSFISLMNEKAEYLVMNDSHFSNPSGYYDDNNYSTASDLALLSKAVLARKELLEIVEKSNEVLEFESNGVSRRERITTTNELLTTFMNAKGLKTGNTFKSGPSYIGYFDSSENDKLVVVLLNSKDRFGTSSEVLKNLQQNYR